MTWAMYATAAIVVLLPFALMAGFHGSAVADNRGRRIARRWTHGQRRTAQSAIRRR